VDLVTVLRIAFSLAVVLGLLWLSYRFAGKGARSTAKAAGAELAVVARQGLTGKSAAVLLRSGGTQYLLGVTESSVTLIDRHDAPAVAHASVIDAAPSTPVPPAAVSSAARAEPLFDDAVTAAQDWLVGAGATPEQDVDGISEVGGMSGEERAVSTRPALPDALRTLLAPATWRRSAQTVRVGRR
jgi:flagellar protein FliO/FliZ